MMRYTIKPYLLGAEVVSSLKLIQATGNRKGKRDTDSEVRKVNYSQWKISLFK